MWYYDQNQDNSDNLSNYPKQSDKIREWAIMGSGEFMLHLSGLNS